MRRSADARYTGALAEELGEEVLERFLRYVAVDTESDPASTTYPSTERQLDLSRLLVDELRAIGLGDVEMKFTGGASIARTKPSGPIPVGLVFSKTFKPHRNTYAEVRP